MLEEMIDNKGNVISTKKEGLLNLDEIIAKAKKRLYAERTYKLSKFKKFIFSAFVATTFLGSLYIANKGYVYHQKRNYKQVDYNLYTTVDLNYCKTSSPCLIKNFNYGEIKINSFGFKGKEISRNKKKNVFRIVCLGGSTTFGSCNISQSIDYPSVLQRLLNDYIRDSGKRTKFEVINAGVGGMDGINIVKRFKYDVMPLNPDLVVYGPEWNDVGVCSIITEEQNLTLKRYFIGLTNDDDVTSLGPWFSSHIDIFRKRKGERLKRLSASVDDTKAILKQKVPLLNVKQHVTLTEEELEKAYRRDQNTQQIGSISHIDDLDPWRFRENVLEIVSFAKERGLMRIGIATTPDDFEDYYFPGIPRNCYILYELNDLFSYNRRVLNPEARKIAEENDLVLIDLEKEINKLQDKKPFFSSEFVHYSDVGTELVGRIYFNHLLPYIKDLP